MSAPPSSLCGLTPGESSGRFEWAMFAVIGCLGLNSLICLYEILQNVWTTRSEPAVTSSSTGWTFRKMFHILLFVSNTARALTLAVEVVLKDPFGDTLVSWDNYLARAVPSLFFFSTYTLLILFWAQLYYSATNTSFPMLQPAFFCFNVAVYGAFIVLAVVTYKVQAYALFWTYSLYVLGAVYAVGALGSTYYGARVAVKLSDDGRSSYSFSTKRMVLRRVLVLSVMCSAVFVIRSVYAFTVSVACVNYYPVHIPHYEWDAAFFLLTEWLPSVVILLLTRRRVPRYDRAYAPPALQSPILHAAAVEGHQ